MFASLHGAYGKDCEAPRLFTTTVGRKPSEAKAYVGMRAPQPGLPGRPCAVVQLCSCAAVA
eukprot:455956-Prymnesium_polylepis.1